MSHRRSDVTEFLFEGFRNYVLDADLFPEAFVMDTDVNRRRFRGWQFLTPLSDLALYTVAAKCILLHRYIYNVEHYDHDLAGEILTKVKTLSPTVEHDVNAWIAGLTNVKIFATSTIYFYIQRTTFPMWNFSA